MKTMRVQKHVVPRPFLKWAGGKGQLLPELVMCVEAAAPFGRYHEPFVGGGALFFDLYRRGSLGRKRAFLSDSNPDLIETYCAVRDNVTAVIEFLKKHKTQHSKDHYYETRGTVPEDPVERAARVIYLNKTCYNGLFRVNSKGGFNVPFGRYENPMICDEENLRAVSVALRRAAIGQRPFETVRERARTGDLVYFDPPYDPVSATASFTGYDRMGFGEASQRLLAEVSKELSAIGVKVLLSNSYTPLVRTLYEGKEFAIGNVYAGRAVNSRGDRRGKVIEALIRNFNR